LTLPEVITRFRGNEARIADFANGNAAGYYITVDAGGHVMHMGRCFQNASYPVTCYELQTNWPAADVS
jgi:hypothetical protein